MAEPNRDTPLPPGPDNSGLARVAGVSGPGSDTATGWPAAATPADVSFTGISEILGIAPLTAGPDPLVGRTIGDVTLVRVVAEGGMGRVYEGRQRSPDRPVAMKVLRPGFITPEGLRRFAREAELLGGLRHPNIAHVYWAGACDILGSAVPFIVMEFVTAALPITAYARDRGLDTPSRLALFTKVCEAVARAHAAGIVHRDLKPGNVLVDAAGEPKLIDFGIARIANGDGGGTAATEIGRLIGTVQYMCPEQITGGADGVDPRTDVYALGLILHELLTGRRPYEIDPRRLFDAGRVISQRRPVSLKVADGRQPAPGLEQLIENCLAFEPTQRYADAAAVARAIFDYTHGEPPRPKRPRWALALTAAAVAVATVSALAPLVERTPDNPPPAASSATRPPTAMPPAELSPASHARPLTVADVQAARSVSGVLTFQHVSTIPLDAAESLVGRGLRVRLPDLPSVSQDLAVILGRNRQGLELMAVRTITPEIATSLTRTGGPLCLDAVESLDVATARILAGHADWLNLAGLRELPADSLAALARHVGHGMAIRVPGTLDISRAEILARHQGMLYLVGLDTVEPAAAKALATHRGPVTIQAEHLTPEIDRLLSELD